MEKENKYQIRSKLRGNLKQDRWDKLGTQGEQLVDLSGPNLPYLRNQAMHLLLL